MLNGVNDLLSQLLLFIGEDNEGGVEEEEDLCLRLPLPAR